MRPSSFYAFLILTCCCTFTIAQNLPAWGIIHNSTTRANQVLALGVNQQGHLNTPNGSGTTANNTNTLNANGSVGTAYKWVGNATTSGGRKIYAPGWYDGTSPGQKWEGWGASAIDSRNVATYGSASVASGGIRNVVVKSFDADEYLNLFPKGKLPSGKPARINKKTFIKLV